MSFKLLQFSPQASTRALRMKMVPERWTEGYEYSRGVKFLPAWLEDDSDLVEGARRHIKWAAISGLALSVAVSGGFWVGVGLLIGRIIK